MKVSQGNMLNEQLLAWELLRLSTLHKMCVLQFMVYVHVLLDQGAITWKGLKLIINLVNIRNEGKWLRDQNMYYIHCKGVFLLYIVWSFPHLHLLCVYSTGEGEGSHLLFDGPGDNDKDTDGNLLWVDKYSPKHYTELLSDDVCECMCNKVLVLCIKINVRELIGHYFHGSNSGIKQYLVILLSWGAGQVVTRVTKAVKDLVSSQHLIRSSKRELSIRILPFSLDLRLSMQLHIHVALWHFLNNVSYNSCQCRR